MPLNTTFLSSECFVLSLLDFFAVVCFCLTYVTELIMKEGNTDNFAKLLTFIQIHGYE